MQESTCKSPHMNFTIYASGAVCRNTVHAALAVYDTPVTVRVVNSMLRFAFVQAIVFALASAANI